MAITKEVTDANLNDEIAKTVLEYTTDLVGTFANTETVGFDVKAIMTEVTEIIFFFRNLYKDNEMLKLYFDENQKDVKRLKEKFGELKANVNSDVLDKYSNMRLIQEAKGFESFTELAEYVGRNMVQSLLFCASKFNTQLGTRIQSVAVLKVLGEENSIGAMESATAERVFGKLFNQNYR